LKIIIVSYYIGKISQQQNNTLFLWCYYDIIM